MKKGLTFEIISQTAFRLTVEQGYGRFTVRELAKELHVKAASLYNHIKSVDDVNIEVGKMAAKQLEEALSASVSGLNSREALEAVSKAYRDFARKNPELQAAIINLPSLANGDEDIMAAARSSLRVIRDIVYSYDIPFDESVYLSRCLRSALVGFVTMEQAGYYSSQDFTAEDSFAFLVNEQIAAIERHVKTDSANS